MYAPAKHGKRPGGATSGQGRIRPVPVPEDEARYPERRGKGSPPNHTAQVFWKRPGTDRRDETCDRFPVSFLALFFQERYPRRFTPLLATWHETEGIPIERLYRARWIQTPSKISSYSRFFRTASDCEPDSKIETMIRPLF